MKGILMNDFESLLEKVFNFYNVSTIKELSVKMDTKESTISNWKQRQSLSALKKRCRELGIYNEIFGDIGNIQKIKGGIRGGQNAHTVQGDQSQSTSPTKHEIDKGLLKLIQNAVVMVDADEEKIEELKKLIKKWTMEQI
ncbi:hypothetical protein KKH82_01140 [Patescibacteria group bacterium]|nr:hypothetical protein [Patescibacteria group bacterium]